MPTLKNEYLNHQLKFAVLISTNPGPPPQTETMEAAREAAVVASRRQGGECCVVELREVYKDGRQVG